MVKLAICEHGVSAIVRNVNTDAARFSLDTLPSDEWGARRTKQIFRAIARAKNAAGLTTDQLATMCSDYLGEPGAIKLGTLNGMFAGKRKSISVVEVEVFAAVLGVPFFDLIYPPREVVERNPTVSTTGAAMIRNAVGDRSRLDIILYNDTLLKTIFQATARAILAATSADEDQVEGSLIDLRNYVGLWARQAPIASAEGVELPELLKWVADIFDPENQIHAKYVQRLRKIFEGQDLAALAAGNDVIFDGADVLRRKRNAPIRLEDLDTSTWTARDWVLAAYQEGVGRGKHPEAP